MRILTLLLTVSCYLSSLAAVVSTGKVFDQNENPLGGVKVIEVETGKYTFTRFDGTFTIFLITSNNSIRFESDGFIPVSIPADIGREMTVFLSRDVMGNQYNLTGYAGFSDFKIKNPNKQLELMPYLLGEADVNRQLQMLPGIEFGTEGFSNLYVRGGNVDQNLMLYNGTPIYNFNHLFGLSSVFHNHSIANTSIYKGVAPSRYGGRLSSTILLESANDLEFSGVDGIFEMSPLSAGLYFRYMEKNNYYFNLSARRTWFDQLIPREVRENDINAYFYDVQLNFGKVLGNGDQLKFSFMNTRDLYKLVFRIQPDSSNADDARYTWEQRWGNVLGSVHWIHDFSKRFRSEHSIHFSQFYSHDDRSEEILNSINTSGIPTSAALYKSGIREYIGRSYFAYQIDNLQELDFGFDGSVKTYRPGFEERSSINYPNAQDEEEEIGEKSYQPAYEMTVYADFRHHGRDKFQYVAGGRFTLYAYDGYIKPAFQPRAQVSYLLDKLSMLKLGFSIQNQFTKLINVGGSGEPRNFWVPSTELVQPERSDLIEMGYERKLGKIYSMALNAYYKDMKNIQVIDNFFEAQNPETDWQASTILGSGSAYGLEVMLQKNEGVLTGWMSYVLSRGTRNFPDLYTEDFLFDFDRTHMAKMYVALEVNDMWSLGANFLLGSGQLFTIPQGKYLDIDGNLQLEYGELNNFRSSVYNRVDLSLIKVSNRSDLDQTWKFYVYNVTVNKNPLTLIPTFENASLTGVQLQRTYITFVPGIAYVVRF